MGFLDRFKKWLSAYQDSQCCDHFERKGFGIRTQPVNVSDCTLTRNPGAKQKVILEARRVGKSGYLHIHVRRNTGIRIEDDAEWCRNLKVGPYKQLGGSRSNQYEFGMKAPTSTTSDSGYLEMDVWYTNSLIGQSVDNDEIPNQQYCRKIGDLAVTFELPD